VSASATGSTLHACIDSPTPGSGVEAGAVRVEGWIVDETKPLQRAIVVADGDFVASAKLGFPRPDVAEAFPAVSHARYCGLRCDLDLRTSKSGPLSLSLLVEAPDGEWRQVAATTLEVTATANGPATRPRAAFTIVKDEAVMLPLWVDYYSRYFAPGDLYVLDHDSRDGSTAQVAGRCQVIGIHRDLAFDHRWLRETVEAFQAFLLRSYETVLFAEVDEFLIADPRFYSGLADYIHRLEAPAAQCVGFNVVHQPDEPALRFDAPILAQRRYWHAALNYNKRLISRVPLRWSEGFHQEVSGIADPADPNLMLVHLHRVDYDSCLARHRASAARNWSHWDVERGEGAQNRISEPSEFEAWFRNGPDLDAPLEFIPAHIRPLL
jgi:Glycosyl transferase family 2